MEMLLLGAKEKTEREVSKLAIARDQFITVKEQYQRQKYPSLSRIFEFRNRYIS